MTHPNKDNQAERDDIHIVGCQMASWLAGISRAELAPESWRTSCAELAARWNEVAGDDSAAPPALDAERLPALPEPKYCADDLTDIYTAEQVRQAQRDAYEAGSMAGRAYQHKVDEKIIERLRARLDQQPARASVDTANLKRLLFEWHGAAGGAPSVAAYEALIAHINAWGGVEQQQEGA